MSKLSQKELKANIALLCSLSKNTPKFMERPLLKFDSVFATGTDYHNLLRFPHELVVEGSGLLQLSIAKEVFKKDVVSMDFTKSETTVEVLTSKGVFIYPYVGSDMFHTEEWIEKRKAQGNFKNCVFIELNEDFKHAQKFVANDQLKPMLNAIAVYDHKVVGTNGHILFYGEIRHDEGIKKGDVVFTKEMFGLSGMVHYYRGLDAESGKPNDRAMITTPSGLEGFFNLPDGRFPDYEGATPKQERFNYTLTIKREDMRSFIQRADVFKKSDRKAEYVIKFDSENFTLSFFKRWVKDDEALFSVLNAFEHTNIHEGYENQQIAFDYEYFKTFMSVWETGDFAIRCTTPNAAAMLGERVFIMPIMLTQYV